MVEKIMGRPLKKPQIPEKELEVQFFIPDHAGTPLFLVDAKGEVLWEALPDDWKATQEVELVKLLVSEYGVRQFIRFQGQWADEETGFYYNRYRFYDPAVGRYISQDPIGLAGGVNLYEYAGNPVDYIDPFGLAQICNRPLKGAPKDIRLWGFGTDLGVYHEHIFYDDGSNQNIGYGQGGTFEERDHEFINDKYRCQLWHPRNEFDDKVMRQAVKEEINTGKWTAEKYNFITHNCQDFVTDVKKRYKAILKNNSQSNGDKPNKGTQK
jgi:type VI secretion system secreted protein VgrG